MALSGLDACSLHLSCFYILFHFFPLCCSTLHKLSLAIHLCPALSITCTSIFIHRDPVHSHCIMTFDLTSSALYGWSDFLFVIHPHICFTLILFSCICNTAFARSSPFLRLYLHIYIFLALAFLSIVAFSASLGFTIHHTAIPSTLVISCPHLPHSSPSLRPRVDFLVIFTQALLHLAYIYTPSLSRHGSLRIISEFELPREDSLLVVLLNCITCLTDVITRRREMHRHRSLLRRM